MSSRPGPRGPSLRTRWTLALLATGALPLALFTYATTAIQRRGLETAERQLEVAVIDHVAETVERSLGEAQAATHRVGQVLTSSDGGDDQRILLARDAVATGGLLGEVAIYGAEGGLIDAIVRVDSGRSGQSGTGGSDPKATPPAHLGADDLARSSTGRWLSPTYLTKPGERPRALLRYLEPVRREGELRAWVLGTLAPDQSAGEAAGEGEREGKLGRINNGLTARLEGISRDRFEGRGDGVLLLDAEGKLLAGGAGALGIGDSLIGKDLFARVALAARAFDEPFAIATEFTSGDGEAMVGAARSLPSRGWAVVVRRPASAVFAALHDARRLLFFAAALFALIAVALGTFLAARTTRPVRLLVDLTRAYARRDFAARSTVRTGDELQELGDSMTAMADDLAAGEREIARRAAVQADLSRYLPAEVASAIAEGKRSLALGGERRRITALFADVVSFTHFAESAPPERVVALLNELFTVMTEVVFRHGGTVDKFIGDCVMAIFGAPSDQPDHARRALAVAEDMHRFVEANAPAWKEKFGVEIQLGIGISSGDALVGNLGSEVRMEYTAIGDVVNVAARLEGLARPGQTLVTADVAEAAGDAFSFAPLGDHPLRGKKQAVPILELR